VDHERFRIGQVELSGDWDACQRRWAPRHRKLLRKKIARANREGGLALRVHREIDPAELPTLVRRGFEVEDRSWKGAAGTSVLRAPSLFQFYLNHAKQLAAWGQLQLSFLELRGTPIAFEFGWWAKQTYCSLKVGYDEAFATLSPGQLLRYHLLERFFATRECQLVDFLGPQTDALRPWTTREYPVGRLVIHVRGWPGRVAIRAYRAWRGPQPASCCER
jgi:CelD/BcsL family acetyltransferase involved in cellulose biosynthesis